MAVVYLKSSSLYPGEVAPGHIAYAGLFERGDRLLTTISEGGQILSRDLVHVENRPKAFSLPGTPPQDRVPEQVMSDAVSPINCVKTFPPGFLEAVTSIYREQPEGWTVELAESGAPPEVLVGVFAALAVSSFFGHDATMRQSQLQPHQ